MAICDPRDVVPQGPCPNCGYCRCCGRSAQPVYVPYITWTVYVPYVPYITWTYPLQPNTAGTFTGNGTTTTIWSTNS
jgi:hypothetical protein